MGYRTSMRLLVETGEDEGVLCVQQWLRDNNWPELERDTCCREWRIEGWIQHFNHFTPKELVPVVTGAPWKHPERVRLFYETEDDKDYTRIL